jgi:ribosomal peptide maturation radical SAM protein 1
MNDRARDLKVALVYPPYGPSGLPSLGLALLSAGIKRLGFECRTFHWNLDVVGALPGDRLEEKLHVYRLLNNRPFLPFNEWVFASVLFGDREATSEAETRRLLDDFFGSRDMSGIRREHILHLRERAGDLVEAMVDKLSPYQVIGINSTFFQNIAALALARRVKERWPDKKVLLGGANCEGEMGKTLLEQFPFVDLVFSGESDYSFSDYVERLSQGRPVPRTDGIYQRDETPRGEKARGESLTLISGVAAPPVLDMDALPIPDFDDFIEDRGRIGIGAYEQLCLPLESSRGCWWGAKQHCTFCGLNGGGMVYRQKSQDRFCDEIEAIVARYGTRFLFMTDNILSVKYYNEFADWAKRRNLGVNFFYEMKSNVTRTQVEKLADARINAVQPGIESFSSKTLSLMRKGTTGIQNIAFLKYAREYGILPVYNILTGFPGEDPAEYERTALELPKLVHLKPPNAVPDIEYHRFSPYHQAPERFGITLRPSQKYGQLYPFTEEVIKRLAYFFDRDDAGNVDRPYVKPLREQVKRWHEHYREDDCQLTWQRAGKDILVHDRRPGFAQRVYRLRDYAAFVFESLDSPKAQKHLLSEASKAPEADPGDTLLDILFGLTSPAPDDIGGDEQLISFSRDTFASDPKRALELLVEPGLVYAEDGRYLSLPVSREHRKALPDWMHLGV